MKCNSRKIISAFLAIGLLVQGTIPAMAMEMGEEATNEHDSEYHYSADDCVESDLDCEILSDLEEGNEEPAVNDPELLPEPELPEVELLPVPEKESLPASPESDSDSEYVPENKELQGIIATASHQITGMVQTGVTRRNASFRRGTSCEL